MANTEIQSGLQNVPLGVNEENVIDDTIFELISEDEIDTLFRLYDKLKDSIVTGKLEKNTTDGITISNTSEYKTHAYLVANSKNFIDGDTILYSQKEIQALLNQNEVLRNRIIQLNEQLNAAVAIINSFGGVLGGMNKSISDFMVSGDNETRYTQALKNFITNFNKFNEDIVQYGINAFLIENQKIDLKTFHSPTTFAQHGGELLQ